MSDLPYYQVLIDHSRNEVARTAAAQMEQTIGALADVRTGVWAQERDWWSPTSEIVNVAVSYTPFDDHDGAKYRRTREFAERLGQLLGTDVRVHDNID